MKKKIIITVGVVLGVVILVPVAALVITFSGNPSIPDRKDLPGGARLIKDGFVSVALLDLGDGQVALIDAGNNKEGKAILAELTRRKLDASAVKAIFLTHGHPDHTSGAHLFKQAEIVALEQEVEMIEGRPGRKGLLRGLMGQTQRNIRVTRQVKDGEVVNFGNRSVEVFAVPGHTQGSAVFLSNGVLFFGDSADATLKGTLTSAKWLFSHDTRQNAQSLKSLAERLSPRKDEIKMLVFAHTGTLDGFGPLETFEKN